MLPPREPSDDAALLRRLQTGTREQAHAAFQVLVERHQPRLFLHLAAKGLTHPEQQDVANETWERAWRLIGDFEYRGIGIFAWLRAIANHVAQEQFKRRFFGSTLGEAQFELADPAADDPEASVLQRLTLQERRAVLRQVLATAPRDYRIVIVAYFFAEQTTEEIMARHGWSRSKVYTTKFRALAWLRERLIASHPTTDMPILH